MIMYHKIRIDISWIAVTFSSQILTCGFPSPASVIFPTNHFEASMSCRDRKFANSHNCACSVITQRKLCTYSCSPANQTIHSIGPPTWYRHCVGGNIALPSDRSGEVGGWLLMKTSMSHLGLHEADKTLRTYTHHKYLALYNMKRRWF